MPQRITPMRLKDIALLCLVSFLWGFNFIVIRWGLDEFPPLLFSALRFTACAAPIALGIPRPKIPWSALILLGITLGIMVFGLLYLGIYFGLGAGLASVLMQTQVFFTILLASLFLGEHIDRRGIVCISAGLAGILLIALGGGSSFTVVGFALTLGGAFAWGISNILLKRLPPVNSLHLMVWLSLVPPLPLFVASAFFEGGDTFIAALRSISAGGLAAILYTSAISTIFAYGVWGSMLRRYRTSQVSQFALLVPVVGLVSAWYCFGTSPTAVQMLGIVAIVFALGANQRARSSELGAVYPSRR